MLMIVHTQKDNQETNNQGLVLEATTGQPHEHNDYWYLKSKSQLFGICFPRNKHTMFLRKLFAALHQVHSTLYPHLYPKKHLLGKSVSPVPLHFVGQTSTLSQTTKSLGLQGIFSTESGRERGRRGWAIFLRKSVTVHVPASIKMRVGQTCLVSQTTPMKVNFRHLSKK